MSLLSNATILRLENQGENIFADERPCIIDRIALAITSGTDLYDIPSYVVQIRRITYRGWKLFPMPHRDLRQSYASGTQGGRPYWYIFNNIPSPLGTNKIKFFPVPQENIASITGPVLWDGEIPNRVIVEFYRLPDIANGFSIPSFLRRRLLKAYVAKRAFEIEGRANNSKAAKYYTQKWEFLKSTYSELLDDLNNSPRKIIANDIASRPYGFMPPSPVLPVSRYGISVDDIG